MTDYSSKNPHKICSLVNRPRKCLGCDNIGVYKSNGYCFLCNRKNKFKNNKSLNRGYVNFIPKEHNLIKCRYPNCNELKSYNASSPFCIKHRERVRVLKI